MSALQSRQQRLLLIGAGHAHAQVLLDFVRRPMREVDVVLVSPSPLAPYSGMVPGWLAGTYSYEAICIDFAVLARAAGATFAAGEVTHFDAETRTATVAGGATWNYDVCSLDVGSTLTPPLAPSATVLSMRPLGSLLARWDETMARLAEAGPGRPMRLTVAGGGAAGVESVLAVRRRLAAMIPRREVRAELVTESATLLPGLAAAAARRVDRALQRAGVTVRLGTSFDASAAGTGDLILWATGAQAHAWQRDSGLAVSGDGFIRVDADLRSLSHRNVFAAGDCIDWHAHPLPKAGVFAVHMGPVLSCSLRALLGSGEAAEPYRPRRRFLSLLSTADGRAIAAWGRWSIEGDWLWHLKDRIDRRFVARFTMPAAASEQQLPLHAGAPPGKS